MSRRVGAVFFKSESFVSLTMASLNKLAIRGIRSFDDKNIAVIEFFSPVTVIVGHNGSGKTVSTSVRGYPLNSKLISTT